MDHYENPRNVGSLDATLKNVGTGLVGAPACGDVMKLQVGARMMLHRALHYLQQRLPFRTAHRCLL